MYDTDELDDDLDADDDGITPSQKRGRYADDDEVSEDDEMAERIIHWAPPITAIVLCADHCGLAGLSFRPGVKYGHNESTVLHAEHRAFCVPGICLQFGNGYRPTAVLYYSKIRREPTLMCVRQHPTGPKTCTLAATWIMNFLTGMR